MKNYSTSGNNTPTAFVTKDKHRLKQFDQTVYLKDGEEFEIELFNPTNKKVLAMIELNGSSLSSGITIRPSERVFLERHIDTKKRFLFDTYSVKGKDKEVLKSIENNGKLTIKFYNEQNYNNIYWGGIFNQPTYGTYTTNLPLTYTSINGSNGVLRSHDSSSSPITCSYSTSNTVINKKEIETGRIEKGSNSKQNLEVDNTNFETFYFHTMTWNILPDSRKEITKDDLVLHCGLCGSKRKKDTHKFCPHCGEKY